MVRRLTSLLLLLLAAQATLAQSFGRFGYQNAWTLPGLRLDSEAIVANHPAADRLRFIRPASSWKPLSTSAQAQSVALNVGAWGPQKAKANLWSPGLWLYFEQGFSFKFGSTGSPYLSWEHGTVEDGVPTPPVKWALLSFKTAQPPILMVFEGEGPGLLISGQSGAWNLKSETEYRGWVRFCLPVGNKGIAANSAATLGQLVQAVKSNQALWYADEPPAPQVQMKADATAVEVTWTFDRPGMAVPVGAALATVGGYPIRTLTKTRRVDAPTEDGPLTVTDEPILKLRFPVRRIPLGRALNVGKREVPPLGTVSPIDIPSIAELALDSLIPERDATARKFAEDAYAEYLTEADYAVEPITKQQLPYAEGGAGIDLAAAHAFLIQAVNLSNQSSSEANSLLTSVSWRRDAYTWRLWVPDAKLARRAAALAALAGALCPEPERRLEAALLEAGIAAERGRLILDARAKSQPEPKLIEPLEPIRRYFFFMTRSVAEEDEFSRSLFGEVRILGDDPVFVERHGEALVLRWPSAEGKGGTYRFASSYPLTILDSSNLEKLEVTTNLGITSMQFTPKAAGDCTAVLKCPEWARPLPPAVMPPRYSEPER